MIHHSKSYVKLVYRSFNGHFVTRLATSPAGFMRIDFLQTSWFIGRWVESRRLSSTMHATRPGKHTKSELENGHRKWIYPLKMVIFHSYVNVYQRVIYEELTPFFCCWVEQLVSFEHHSTCTNVFFRTNKHL